MKAIFAKASYDIQVLDRPLPVPGPDEVVVRILACGVCGTDLHLVRNSATLTPLGHEIAAEVVECGPLVRGYRPGDTVTVEDNTLCGVCEQCKNGHPERCRNLFTMNGQSGMAEYLAVNYRALNRYEGLSPEHACLTEPATVSLILCQNARVGLTDKVVVMGGGVVGLVCVRIAKRMGASTVVMVGGSNASPRGQARLAAAKALGADFVLASSDTPDIPTAVKDLLHGGADSVIVTSPPKTLPTAMALCAYGGVLSVAGIDLGPNNKAEIDVDALVFNKLTIQATLTEPSLYFPTTTKMLQEGSIPADLLVNRLFGFADAKETITANAKGTEPILKAVFTGR